MLVTLTLLACAGDEGADGLSTLVNVVDEPAGAHCPIGGSAIEQGVDDNGDGVLDAAEVVSTAYVCTEPNTTVSLAVEPVGENCRYGGTAVHSGLDTNGNGLLDSDEILSSEYVCEGIGGFDPVIQGNVVILRPLDVSLLAPFTEITGNLVLNTDTVEVIDLPNLESVNNLNLSRSALVTLSLPALTTVGGNFTVTSANLETLILSSLSSLRGNLTLNADSLLGLALPELVDPNGMSLLTDALTSFSAPKLVSAEQDINLTTPSLPGVTFPLLGTVRIFRVNAIGAGEVAVPSLLTAGALQVNDSDAIGISAPLLASITNPLGISDNAMLSSFDFTALDEVGNVVIANNPLLPCSEVVALVAQLSTVGATSVSGNGTGVGDECP